MSLADAPIPSSVSEQTRKVFENAPPLEHWSVAPGDIDALRRHEWDGCAPFSERARDIYAVYRRLSTRMRLAGVDARLHVWEGMWHTFEWYLELPEAQASLDEIADFLGAHAKSR